MCVVSKIYMNTEHFTHHTILVQLCTGWLSAGIRVKIRKVEPKPQPQALSVGSQVVKGRGARGGAKGFLYAGKAR